MSAPVVLTESLGGSSLSRAARAGQLPQWYRTKPADVSAWREYARSVQESAPPRWLDALAPAFNAQSQAADRLRRSANGKGLVVTTGQQPGLFGGPLMTFAKALTARALADVLQETLGIPVAPVFWAATDDADFDEAARVSVALDGGARELMLEDRAPAGTPVTRVPLGSEVERLFEPLRAACGSLPNAQVLDLARHAYRDGVTIGDSYVELLRAILEPLGIAVLDVSHPCVAAASTPVMRHAAERAGAVAAAVKRRSDDVLAAGYSIQVEEVPGLAHLFVNERGTKRRLTIREAESLQLSGDQWLSSTVLMRPVLERALLPTAAYLGGPGEVAYFAQVSAVSDALELPAPMVLPRWSTTIIEPRVQRILDTLGISAESLSDPHEVDGRLVRARLSPEVDSALRALQTNLNADVDRLANVNGGLISNDVLEGVRRSVGHRLERLERRVVAAAKRRETDLMRQLATARGALYPHGSRQERKLAYVPFLARYGQPLVDQMLAAATAYARSLVGVGPSLKASSSSPAVIA